MKRPFPLAVLATTLAAQNPATIVESTITTDDLAATIRFLSSDLLEGRGVGTRGDLLAREYIATRMQAVGLRPGGAEGSWNQPVPIVGITTAVTATLSAKGSQGERSFAAPDEFTAVAGSAEAAPRWQDAEVVFVGYGIDAPEQSWDDFKDVDVRGKVLLVMNSDPENDPNRFAGRTRLYYGRWSYKFEEAARRGAIGAIVIHTDPSAGYPWQVVQANHGRENFWLPFAEDQPTLALRSWATETASRQLCALGGHDLDALRAAANKDDFRPVALGVTVALSCANTLREFESGNVLGVLPGSDPDLKDQVVVVTAHFDHLGIGKPRNNDSIYNGALDNGTGIAGMLAIARACAALPRAPRRTVLFAAVTAEESGLLGSQWYAEHPTYPRDRLVANYNIDGLNIWGPTRDVEFIGHGKNSLTDLAQKVAATRGRRLEPDSQPDLGLFYRSDHFNFARIGVPAAYLKAGGDFLDRPEDRRRMKASYTTVHYHQPSDEMAPWWNLAGAVDDLQLLLECLLQTASLDQPPGWTPGDEFEKRR
ncbi:MAG: M20/M25/M40 family metallo-hydrolase [Planctomycetes bacterium]|nr:M20/M25/M40 family metallo-hydrolase [Planctomycetota bacterium]